MNEKQKEIMYEICKIDIEGDMFRNLLVGGRKVKLIFNELHNYNAKYIIELKGRISKYVANISAPTLDVCYHIKHKNIVIKKKEDYESYFRYHTTYMGRYEKVLLSNSYDLYYGDKHIDLDLFTLYEKSAIEFYVEQRIEDVIKEEKRKELENKEQKRKELIDIFDSI